jgi:hypothetical protein
VLRSRASCATSSTECVDLEHIERALREAERTSSRARRARAREHVLTALSETDDLVVEVSNAWDALTFHWGATTPLPH